MDSEMRSCRCCRALFLRLEALEALVKQEREIADRRHKQVAGQLGCMDAACSDAAEEMRAELRRVTRLVGGQIAELPAAQDPADTLADLWELPSGKGGGA